MTNPFATDPGTGQTRLRKDAAAALIQRMSAAVEDAATLAAQRGRGLKLDDLVGLAMDTVRTSLMMQDDKRVALWLLDRVTISAAESALPPEAQFPDLDLGSMEGVMLAGQRITERMMAGDLAVVQADNALKTLHRYAQLRMVDEVRRLDAVLRALEEARQTPEAIPQVLPPERLPAWGKLRGEAAQEPQEAAPPSPSPPDPGSPPRPSEPEPDPLAGFLDD